MRHILGGDRALDRARGWLRKKAAAIIGRRMEDGEKGAMKGGEGACLRKVGSDIYCPAQGWGVCHDTQQLDVTSEESHGPLLGRASGWLRVPVCRGL